jgi:hypothetical protein
MNKSVVVVAVAFALTACGRTELAAQPAPPLLAALGVSLPPQSVTEPFTVTSPCTGEILDGPVTFTFFQTLVTDASGGTHGQIDVDISGTYLGNAGTTFTQSGAGRSHFNTPSSGTLNAVSIYTSRITGSDGTTILAKVRVKFVSNANGVVTVAPNPVEIFQYSCQRG